MSNSNQEPFDLSNVEFKMPEENFLETEPTPAPKRALPVILILIIVLLLMILGGLVWWGKALLEPTPPPEVIPTVTKPLLEETNEPETENAEADVAVINTTSSSGDWPDIKADIESTDISVITKELTTVDNMINMINQ